MERAEFVRHHGLLRLPPGFRFHPTDEELLLQYLKRKVLSFPLPAAVIPDIHLENHDPWDLPRTHLGGGDEAEEEEEERYFFNLRQSNCAKKAGNRSARPTRSGYWKATGKDRPVAASRPDRTVGTKRAFAFYLGKPRRGSRTDWFMHEYSLSADEIRAFSMCHAKNPTPLNNISSMFEIKDWVVCRIFKKNRATKFDAEIKRRRRSTEFAGFVTRQSNNQQPYSPSPSSSSCVTDLSDNGEENSSYNIDSSPRED